jgi:hypothetical protein
MYLLTYIFIVDQNSYDTLTKVLSDWGYVQAGALVERGFVVFEDFVYT